MRPQIIFDGSPVIAAMRVQHHVVGVALMRGYLKRAIRLTVSGAGRKSIMAMPFAAKVLGDFTGQIIASHHEHAGRGGLASPFTFGAQLPEPDKSAPSGEI